MLESSNSVSSVSSVEKSEKMSTPSPASSISSKNNKTKKKYSGLFSCWFGGSRKIKPKNKKDRTITTMSKDITIKINKAPSDLEDETEHKNELII